MRRFAIRAPAIEDPLAKVLVGVDVARNLDAVDFAPLYGFDGKDKAVAKDLAFFSFVPGETSRASDSCEFKYFASDTSQAVDQVSITSIDISVFPNGYEHRFAFGLQAQPLTDTLTDFVVWIDVSQLANATDIMPHLKSTSNGGKVYSTSGFDIRFEDINGVKLAHRFETYDPTTGDLRVDIKIPSWQLNTKFRGYMYIGQNGISATEEDAASCWSGALAVIDPITGVDMSGHGRSFTVTTAPGSTTLIGRAAQIGDTSRLQGSSSWLDGLTQASFEFWFQIASATPTTDDTIMRIGNTSRQAVIRSDPTPDYGTGTGALQFSTVLAGGERFAELAGALNDTNRHHWVMTVNAGVLKIYKDGALQTLTGSGGTSTGNLATQAAQIELWDTTVVTAAHALNGKGGRFIFWPTERSSAWIATTYSNQNDVPGFMGFGQIDTFTVGNKSPIAMPIRKSGSSGVAITTNVVTEAIQPDTGETLTCTAAGPASPSGTVTRNSTSVTLTASTAANAVFRVPYAISDGSKTSKSFIIYSVSAVTSPFPNHKGPMVTHSVSGEQVPLFMRDFTYTASATRKYSESRSGRQFRSGGFSMDPAGYNNYMGAQLAFAGGNCISYKSAADLIPSTWNRYAGGDAWDPANPSGFNSAITAQGVFPANRAPCNVRHANLSAWWNTGTGGDLSRMLGIYMSTLPWQVSVADAIAAANGDASIINWHKAYAKRLKASASANQNPIIVVRTNWEAQGQNTGMQLTAVNAGTTYTGVNWYKAGLTQAQYNDMMYYFIDILMQEFDGQIYVAFSPAFETVRADGFTNKKQGNPPTSLPAYSYASYWTRSNGNPVGYNFACGSCHPVAGRADTEAEARSVVNGSGLTEGDRYWLDLAIAKAKADDVVFGVLEHGFGDLNNEWGHGPTRYYAESYDEIGARFNDPANYGIACCSGILGSYMIDEAPTTACSWGSSTSDTSDDCTTTRTSTGGDRNRVGCQAHATGGQHWSTTNRSNYTRAIKQVKKSLGHINNASIDIGAPV